MPAGPGEDAMSGMIVDRRPSPSPDATAARAGRWAAAAVDEPGQLGVAALFRRTRRCH